jgi:hypothetical protein
MSKQPALRTNEAISGPPKRKQMLYLSLALNPGPFTTFNNFYLSACIAVCLATIFFNNYVGNELALNGPMICYWMRQENGGILIE